ncbi:MAG TPA: hypothetical protein VJ771_05535 [Candidatus Nitrosotalea sp.]|nr:hypothetical protein [Candidatus Nitrosotalea sp.]
METSKQSIRTAKTQIIILVVMYAFFVPFSLSWYYTLVGLDCKNQTFGLDHVTVGQAVQKQHICYDNLQWHWIAFYGTSGMIFSAPLLVLVRTLHKNRSGVKYR